MAPRTPLPPAARSTEAARLPFAAFAAFAAFGFTACRKPPEPPPQPPTETIAPPPAPKCESISEKCGARVNTRARVTNSELVVAPVAGWIYAQQSSATIAQANDVGAAMALTGVDVDPKDVRKSVANKDAALAELFNQIGLAPLKTKIPWKTPVQSKPLGGFTLQLWQLEKAGLRAQKKGDLLVVAVQVTDAKVVVGVGFVPDDDKTDADVAIMKSIESLGQAQ